MFGDEPKLPAMTLATACYRLMFRDCAKLTSAPDLPATSLKIKCYAHMFEGCSSMTKAPALLAEALRDSCYAYMFKDCSALSSVTMMARNNYSGASYCWLDGVGAFGTLSKHESAVLAEDSVSGVPTGWEVNETPIEWDAIPVDLGLSVKWSAYNLGATRPEETGCFFAWGETEIKGAYSWETYNLCRGTNNTLTKYCTNNEYGVVDGKTILELSDDAAHAHLGGGWRVPSREEWQELVANCTWQMEEINNLPVVRLTSTVPGYTDKSIILPYDAGVEGETLHAGTGGAYWSSTANHSLRAFRSLFNTTVTESPGLKCYGRLIRPVSD